MRLLGTRLLVSPIAAKLISVGGIHLPHQYQHGENEKTWRVLGVGQGVEEIRVGDAVLVPNWSHRDDLGGGRFILEQREVVAVIREEPPPLP